MIILSERVWCCLEFVTKLTWKINIVTRLD